MEDHGIVKKRYLAVYDYGMGGIWCYIHAESAEQIEKLYPELKVIEKEPDWHQGEHRTITEEKFTYDIDKPTGWLLNLVNSR
ncbi:hypothetical protein K1X76_11355 [bacterium]|nr:hypothetical protein [bacterium]